MQDINKIKMIISDVDGVWTDGSVYKGFSATENIELKKFSVSDGYAVALIREAGLKVALISGRKSAATEARASELKIKDVYNGTLNKIPPYEELKSKYALSDKEIAYVGDDLIDVGPCAFSPNSPLLFFPHDHKDPSPFKPRTA